MKYFLSLLVLIPTLCFAASSDRRISDADGHVLVITSGKLTASNTNTANTNSAPAAHDVRISDNEGDVLILNADGSINVTIN